MSANPYQSNIPVTIQAESSFSRLVPSSDHAISAITIGIRDAWPNETSEARTQVDVEDVAAALTLMEMRHAGNGDEEVGDNVLKQGSGNELTRGRSVGNGAAAEIASALGDMQISEARSTVASGRLTGDEGHVVNGPAGSLLAEFENPALTDSTRFSTRLRVHVRLLSMANTDLVSPCTVDSRDFDNIHELLSLILCLRGPQLSAAGVASDWASLIVVEGWVQYSVMPETVHGFDSLGYPARYLRLVQGAADPEFLEDFHGFLEAMQRMENFVRFVTAMGNQTVAAAADSGAEGLQAAVMLYLDTDWR
ncbi:hypothetical protein UCRPC4_g04460 [Phaeomoniella chlamydospora]|uniref:Uncharacterized protein n=1 Tax=Phaeomoniella chlamydospora TaxID=158046 RepID=A0A0G2EB81_PHACM|nr:hypothetical protein UCRPC4_g04460 [Phaeomoniella chlamydospora]